MDNEVPNAEIVSPQPSPSAPASVPWPPQIIVNCGPGRFQRLLGWMGWAAFGVSVLILISMSFAVRQYFDTTEGIQERFHSGERTGRDKVAIISVTGAILDGRGFVKNQIDQVMKDKSVKAVVVRVSSPGGTITGSDYILHHLSKMREERDIPLVVSMGSIAASGGYYVSMAVGDQPNSIYAEPTTTTGSIGVVIPHYNLAGLLERFDVEDDSLVSHPNKRIMSMTRPMSDEQREIMKAYLEAAFVRFKDQIKRGRPAFRDDPEALDHLATGEVFTAEQAREHGLIDEIGFVEDAIERAFTMAELDESRTRVVEYRRPPSLFDLALLSKARHSRNPIDLAYWLDLHVPQAYYLMTTLPPLLTYPGQ